MNVTRGWSADFGKAKFSIMVEEADLLRMLAERGAEDPVKVREGIPSRHAYLIMDAEAMSFLHDVLRRREPEGSEARDGQADRVREHRAERNRLLDIYVPQPGKPEEPAG